MDTCCRCNSPGHLLLQDNNSHFSWLWWIIRVLMQSLQYRSSRWSRKDGQTILCSMWTVGRMLHLNQCCNYVTFFFGDDNQNALVITSQPYPPYQLLTRLLGLVVFYCILSLGQQDGRQSWPPSSFTILSRTLF